jgi:hypothetical protein
MQDDERIDAILDNQKLILERLAHIEAHLDAVYHIQGDYLKGCLSTEDQTQRDGVLANYTKRPEAALEHFRAQGVNRFQQGH